MERFNGFSQDEINKVLSEKKAAPVQNGMKQAFRGHHGGIRRMPEKWSAKSTESLKKQQVKFQPDVGSAKTTNSAFLNDAVEDTLDNVNLDSSLSKSIEEALFYQPMQKPADVKVTNGATSADDSSILKLPASMDSVVSSTSNDDTSILGTQKHESEAAPSSLNVDSPFKGISLKDFEVHRKMIQEQNKQKKELLYKAIEHHSQKTAAEARKIEDIKVELAKLDNDLAVDVAILRKQIDNACINFATIEKQYVKIEAQFLKAKIDLHNAAEKKELLTEHLCTVIAHNEDRKAQKLSELMEKVGLSPTADEYFMPSSTTDVDN